MLHKLLALPPRRRGRKARPVFGASSRWEGLEARQLLAIDFSSLTGIGSTGTLLPQAVAMDELGNTYVTGNYSGTTTLDPSSAGASKGFTDIFIAKITPSGTTAWFHGYGAASASCSGQGIAVDGNGNVYTTGYFTGAIDFDSAHPGAHRLTALGGIEGFVLKLDQNGNFGSGSYAIKTIETAPPANPATFNVGGAVNQFLGIAVDTAGDATVVGRYEKTITFGGQTLIATADQEPFVARLTPTGSVAFLRAFGTTADSSGGVARAVSMDAQGNAYVVGEFSGSTAFPGGRVLVSTRDASNKPSVDAFMAKINSAGDTVYADSLGGPGVDLATGVAADGAGNAYVVGIFSGTAGLRGKTVSTTGPSDVFVARLVPTGDPVFLRNLNVQVKTLGQYDGPSVAVDDASNGFFTAMFQGTGKAGSIPIGNAGGTDLLVGKISGTTGDFLTISSAGGAGTDGSTAIAHSPNGKFAVTGIATPSADPPTRFGSLTLPNNGAANGFVAVAVDNGLNEAGPGGGTGVGSGGLPPSYYRNPPGDFDGDGKTDEAVFDPTTATYYVRLSGGGSIIKQFGVPNGKCMPVAGDFDGDGKTDLAVFDPTTATYYIQYSGGGSVVRQFGVPNGKGMMVPGDFDGDGKTDECVFDPVTATYYIRYSNPNYNGGSRIQQFGIPNGQNLMVAGDFDGDGKTDECIFDPVQAKYYIRYSDPNYNGGSRIQQFGIPNGKNTMVPGDFDGDGKTDECVFDPGTATYYIRYSNPNYNGGSRIQQFGVPNGKNFMLTGDYDGDRKTDESVFDPVSATFYTRFSGGDSRVVQFGVPNGRNIPATAVTRPGSTALVSLAGAPVASPNDLIAAPTGSESIITSGHARKKNATRDAAIHHFGS